MKKHRQKAQETTKHQETFEETQIHQVSMSKNHDLISEKPSHHKKKTDLKNPAQQPSSNGKTCLESARQKMNLYFLSFLNYFQFDQAFTKQQFQALRSQPYIFKTRFPDNYYLSYEERAKTFGITVDEIIKKKQEEEQQKPNTLWTQIKKFVCCQGADQLEEVDEMITAASDSQFYYLTRAKHNNKQKENLELTEESMIQKPMKNPTKFPEKQARTLVRETNFSENKEDFFFHQKDNLEEPFEEIKQKSPINKSKPLINGQNSNQLDLQAIQQQSPNKRTHKRKATTDLAPIDSAQNVSQEKIQEKTQENVSGSPSNNRNKKTTEKIHVRRKSDDENQGQEHQVNTKIQSQNVHQSHNNKNQEDDIISEPEAQLALIKRGKDKKSDSLQKEQERQIQTNNQELSEISQYGDKAKMHTKKSESTLSGLNSNAESLKNTFKLRKEPFQRHNHSFEASSNNQSTEKMLAFNSSYFEAEDPQNIFQEENISSYVPLEESQIRSVAQSEAQGQPVVEEKNKKKKKKKGNKGDDRKSEDSLEINDYQQSKIKEVVEQHFEAKKPNEKNVQENIINDKSSLQRETKHNYSVSSDNIGRKAEKNAFKFDAFEGADFSIQEKKQEYQHHEKTEANQISFNDTSFDSNLSERSVKVSKKRKNKNKKLFNLKEEEESVNEVVFFPQNEGEQFSENLVSKTISFDDSFSNASMDGGVVKKRKKNKKIKELNREQNDEIIVLEAGEMLEDGDRNLNWGQEQIIDEGNYGLNEASSGALVKGEKKKKKRKAKLKEDMEKQELEVLDLGEMN